MRFRNTLLVVAMFALIVLTACQPVMVESELDKVDEQEEISVIATDEGINDNELANREMSPGLTTFSFDNQRSNSDFGPSIVRLNDDVTVDALVEAASSDDPMSAVSMLTLYGSSWLQQGVGITFETYLSPGNYLFLEQDPTSVGDVTPFTVLAEGETSSAEPPNADIDLSLQDFAFVMPDTIAAGDNVWHISNDGDQWHEISIFPVPDGSTPSGILEMLHDESNDDEPEVAFQFGPISSGLEIWSSIELAPGTYVALCFLPDIDGDFTTHFDKGMIRVFTVE
ncbi:MAG: hypothetical protein ACK2UK_00640 [Candidatus Promineifilaceae bacterium]